MKKKHMPVTSSGEFIEFFGNEYSGYRGCTRNLATTDKDEPIRTFMHYTEPRENQSGITVFGREENGLFYNYDDRIGHTSCREGGPKFFDCLGQVVSESGLQTWTNGVTARMIEKSLAMYHGKPVDLRHVMLGCNLSNGYSWLCFGYVVEG